MRYIIEINGKIHEVDVEEKGSAYMVTVDGITYEARMTEVSEPEGEPKLSEKPSITQAGPGSLPLVKKPAGSVTAPMPGTILKVFVSAGTSVNVGQPLVILETMKMENEISSPLAGLIREVHVKEGQTVNTGDVLVTIS